MTVSKFLRRLKNENRFRGPLIRVAASDDHANPTGEGKAAIQHLGSSMRSSSEVLSQVGRVDPFNQVWRPNVVAIPRRAESPKRGARIHGRPSGKGENRARRWQRAQQPIESSEGGKKAHSKERLKIEKWGWQCSRPLATWLLSPSPFPAIRSWLGEASFSLSP
jgi:hypothetical protein